MTPNISADGSFFDVDGTAGSDYNLTIPYDGEPTINITWRAAGYDRTLPIFLAIMVVGDDGICTPNNIKIYKIEPRFAFTLDIDNLLADGTLAGSYGDNINKCISDIQSAVYNAAAPEGIDYDFGENVLYYEVVAANWYDRWQLSTRLTGLQTGQTATIDWAYAPTTRPIDFTTIADWYNVAPAGSVDGDFTSSTHIQIQASGAPSVDDEGESIIIRVTVDHGTQWQGIDIVPIELRVDGVLVHDISGTWTPADPSVEGDIHTEAGGTPSACPWFDGFTNDVATQTILARPAINSLSPPAPGYLPIR